MDYNKRLTALFVSQIKDWPLAKENYAALKFVEERELEFGNCTIRLQHNPARILSTGANISKESIKKRACFLCASNRPQEQEGIDYMGKYELLVNPFPIMSKHFTIVHKEHVKQSVEYFPDMLSLAQDLKDYSIVYNGAECGASAPDHMHFQAGSKDFIQTELELDRIIGSGDQITFSSEIKVYKASGYLRDVLLIKSDNKASIISTINEILVKGVEYSKTHKDAKLNIICRYDNNIWTVIMFLRKAHRPSHYTREKNILISPGVIDMGGVLICPRKEDYQNITKQEIREIYSEVSL